ncbi:ArsR/SmtB family transcription factor [Nocardia sp. NPDC058499]|uniref:ArsR/SmtB family transcription factor n=1 Tax=Nocardia sp. NPDC058499 TaxID=3346530 RepID=UPI003657BC56
MQDHIPGHTPAAVTVYPTARFFQALSDPTRLRLLEFILAAERTAAECMAHTGISQPRVSVHLSSLTACGYVRVRRRGRILRYTVGDPRVRELIGLARALAADHMGPPGFDEAPTRSPRSIGNRAPGGQPAHGFRPG